ENLGGAIAVNIRVVLKSGYRAVTVAKQIQQTVKQSVQDMTGVTAVNVNVEVSGVEFDA
ncbi:MAG: Asp23/Gls24 family envelope stress response protein, partial [Oscillospiraceae bacterium]|nr:Asp23/Gls24 family envelope stress response protein [Oscillospiraceae bacterium]